MEWNLKEKSYNHRLIGLTGGIACGKSTVGKMFMAQGASLLDCDKLYHQLLLTNIALKEDLIKAFGTANRHDLAAIVFNQPEKLQLLNFITHPFIATALQETLTLSSPESITIIEATLLFESGLGNDLPVNIAVSCPVDTRIKHLMNRNQLSESQAISRINAQSDDYYRCQKANFVINNEGSLTDLENSVYQIWHEILKRI